MPVPIFSHVAEELIRAEDIGVQRLVGHPVLEVGEPGGQTGGVGGAVEILLVGGLHEVLLGLGAGEDQIVVRSR